TAPGSDPGAIDALAVETLAELERLRLSHAILESAWAVHWLIEADGVVKYVSPTRRQMGLPELTPDGVMTIFDILPPATRPRARAAVAEAAANPPDRPVFYEATWDVDGVLAEREAILVNRLAHPILRGIVVTSIDVGPRNLPRQALRESELRF